MTERQALITLRSCLNQSNCTFTRKKISFNKCISQVMMEFVEDMKIIATYIKWQPLPKWC